MAKILPDDTIEQDGADAPSDHVYLPPLMTHYEDEAGDNEDDGAILSCVAIGVLAFFVLLFVFVILKILGVL